MTAHMVKCIVAAAAIIGPAALPAQAADRLVLILEGERAKVAVAIDGREGRRALPRWKVYPRRGSHARFEARPAACPPVRMEQHNTILKQTVIAWKAKATKRVPGAARGKNKHRCRDFSRPRWNQGGRDRGHSDRHLEGRRDGMGKDYRDHSDRRLEGRARGMGGDHRDRLRLKARDSRW